ncbi:MAG: DUF6797 domain-containing protein [Isosphaeraceae bacterium]
MKGVLARIALWTGVLALCELAPLASAAPPLDDQLRSEKPEALAAEARQKGDAARGAVLFFQPYLSCAKCHAPDPHGKTLGPDLARDRRELKDFELIQAVLNPSKEIRKGFETLTVATHDGRTLRGLLVAERPDALLFRDPSGDGRAFAIPKTEVAEHKLGGDSVMPVGLINALPSRREALDLFRYLIEINDEGPVRAIELKPSPWEIAGPPLPEYEKSIDHAGLIGDLDAASLKRGEAIYGRVCVTCHGTLEKEGSLPTSLRFATGAFKNGSDPFAMYQTLTHGYGQMAAQTWMTPGQKYDVIHYIRQTYLAPHNRTQWAEVTTDYLAKLPKGTLRGPAAEPAERWRLTDHGPSLMLTLEVDHQERFAFKGVAVRLDSGPGGVAQGRQFVVYDHDTMQIVGAWTGPGFVDWHGINFDGQHNTHPRTVGKVRFSNPAGPAWAHPTTGTFQDPRIRGRDGLAYGPLPRHWLRFLGNYRHGDRLIFSYKVGEAAVLETAGAEAVPGGGDALAFSRTLDVGRSPHDLSLRVAPSDASVALVGGEGARVVSEDGYSVLRLSAARTPARLKVLISDGDRGRLEELARKSPAPESLEPLTHGGPPSWPNSLTSKAALGAEDGPFASDELTPPADNPWKCQFRFTGFDFTRDGRTAFACTWDGDVWKVSGVDDLSRPLTWRRVASGLFQPLGVRLVDGKVYEGCRDQIVILRDLNGDGETDFYETFNTDHQVTEHFHEFAMDLQTDTEGNFYYAKGARHALKALVPQHGTLLKVAKDGSSTEILATGFRAPNGVCLNPDGSFFMTDQEGHWIPKNRINRVVKRGFYGNMWGYHDVTDPSDSAMKPPVCWITNAFDRSPSELLWADAAGPSWGPLRGSLLSLSYGYGKVFVVPHETVAGQMQGGLCELPIRPFPTGVIRGRFHPASRDLYLCGMFAWAGSRTEPGGFYRLRATGKPAHVVVGLKARRGAMELTFSDSLDPKTAADAGRWAVRVWSLRRSANYGSPHVGEHRLSVASSKLLDDGKTVRLELPDLTPTTSMQIAYEVLGARGEPVEGRVQNTVHHLGD